MLVFEDGDQAQCILAGESNPPSHISQLNSICQNKMRVEKKQRTDSTPLCARADRKVRACTQLASPSALQSHGKPISCCSGEFASHKVSAQSDRSRISLPLGFQLRRRMIDICMKLQDAKSASAIQIEVKQKKITGA
jgi:hypothetical protein